MTIIETGQLLLRKVNIDDVPYIHELHSLAEIDRYNTMGIPADMGITTRLVEEWLTFMSQTPQQKLVFCIQNENNDVVGITGINIGRPNYRDAEIWYKLHPDYWNKGYATQVVKGLLEYCFTTLQLHRVAAGCATKNTASVKVLEKSGFTREGHCRKKLHIRGEWVDNYEYAILEEDYFSGEHK